LAAQEIPDKPRHEEKGDETEEIDLEPFRSERSSAGYRGVCWNRSWEKYQAKISVNGQEMSLGSFGTAEEAARAYARAYLRKHGGPPAPPVHASSLAEQSQQEKEGEKEENDLEPFRSEKSSAGYRGVSWIRSSQKYQAKIKVNGQEMYLGLFGTAEDAAKAYARAYLRQQSGPPAPPASSLAEHFRQEEEEGEEGEIDLELFRSETHASGYRGVSWKSRDRKYTATIKVNGRRKHLGSFGTAEEAARAYARAYLRQQSVPPDPSLAERFPQEEEGDKAPPSRPSRKRKADALEAATVVVIGEFTILEYRGA